MTNARTITNAVRKALREDNLLARTTTRTEADFRFVTKGGKRVQVPVFRTVIEVSQYAALTRAKLTKAGFDVSPSESSTIVIIYTPRPSDEPTTQEVVPVEQPRVITDIVIEGNWYLVPAKGERLTDRHDLLGPYTTQDLVEHMRKTYADEGIEGVVVQSATRPTLAARGIAEDLGEVTLADLITRRRSAAELFRRQERPATDEIAMAARRIDVVDAELTRRDRRYVMDLLVTEGSLLVARDHAERNDYAFDRDQADDLVDTKRRIASALRLFGDTTQ